MCTRGSAKADSGQLIETSPTRPYIVFSTVENPRQTGEDTYSKFSAS